jgi:transposase
MPVSPGSPDVAVLRARLDAAERLIGELRRELAARDAVIAAQADRIAQLERQVKRDSSSSSRPPSSDSPYKKKSRDRSLREKTGRRPGKQPGAPGATLGLSDH